MPRPGSGLEVVHLFESEAALFSFGKDRVPQRVFGAALRGRRQPQ